MSALQLARLQFGDVTVYHFIFVPITIGITWLVAVFQTLWYRSGDAAYLRLTRFFGKLMLINFAIGVVTGIVQEFQFGMNWSTYSRYVGDVFGAPLAMEGLAAFFLESTFLGLWIFGWDRLGKRTHLATIYLTAFGTNLSAYFILAANSWMQHPVGYRIDPATGHAHLTSILEVLTNSTVLYAFPHTIGAAVMTASALVAGVSAWHLRRGSETAIFMKSIRLALPLLLVASLFTTVVGHGQAQLMTKQQPMKMAAAEALYTTRTHASLSAFAVAPFEEHPTRSSFDVRVPDLLSILATNSLGGKVEGINTLEHQYQAKYGPGDYRPVVGVTYWMFRIMAGIGVVLVLLSLYGMWLLYRGTIERSHRFLRLTTWAIALPLLANASGWIFTEMGRQPWVVQGLLLTRNAVSPSVSAWEVATTLIGFTLLYTVLGVIDGWLMLRFAKEVPPASSPDTPAETGNLAMVY